MAAISRIENNQSFSPEDASRSLEDTQRKQARRKTAISLVSLTLIVGAVLPTSASAGIFGETLSKGLFGRFFGVSKQEQPLHSTSYTLQTLPLPKAAMSASSGVAVGGGDVIITGDSALVPEEGPSGAGADIVKPKNSTISVYVVREGDTLSTIGQMFDVSVNTIIWANDLKRGAPIQVGQTLTILPVTGLRYTVKKGDTLASIAKDLHADAEEIVHYNGIDPSVLAAGDELIIPNGEVAVAVAATPAPKTTSTSSSGSTSSGSSYVGYYLRPVKGIKTQGVHGYNGVDIGAPTGTPFVASASGEVIVAKASGWNGGYGQYVVIRHDNGTQTLYAHASDVIVGIGQRVVQGQVIGYVGTTGRSTGPHLHFEIRGGPRNPF